MWSVFPFRAKPEGWFGSPGPYVHVFPSRQPALARTQGILESAQWRALFQFSVGIEGVADLMFARSTKGMIGCRDEKQGLVTLDYIVNAHLGFGSSVLLSFVFFPVWILLPCFWIFHNLFPCPLPALSVLLSSLSVCLLHYHYECSQCVGEFLEQIDDSSCYTFYQQGQQGWVCPEGELEMFVHPI